MPERFGGMGLDWRYEPTFYESMREVNCGSIPMAVGVQTNMATPTWPRSALTNCARNFWRQLSPVTT